MLSQPSVEFVSGLNQVCNFIFNSSLWISSPGTFPVNPNSLLGSTVLCSKSKIFPTDLYSVWRIISGSRAVLINYALGGWEHSCVYIGKYTSPLTIPWFLENYHFFHMDGPIPTMSLPLALPVAMQDHSKKGGGWIDSSHGCLSVFSCSMHEFLLILLFSDKKNGFPHMTLLSQRTERLHFCQMSVSKTVSCNKGLSSDFRRSWMCQILRGIWVWCAQHQHNLKSVSPEFNLHVEETVSCTATVNSA